MTWSQLKNRKRLQAMTTVVNYLPFLAMKKGFITSTASRFSWLRVIPPGLPTASPGNQRWDHLHCCWCIKMKRFLYKDVSGNTRTLLFISQVHNLIAVQNVFPKILGTMWLQPPTHTHSYPHCALDNFTDFSKTFIALTEVFQPTLYTANSSLLHHVGHLFHFCPSLS